MVGGRKGRKGVQSIIGGGRNTGGMLKNSFVGPKGIKANQQKMHERIARATEGTCSCFVVLYKSNLGQFLRPW